MNPKLVQVSDCGTFFVEPIVYRRSADMEGKQGECTFCFNPSIMRDADLNVEYCEYHAKVLSYIVEKEKGNGNK